LENRGKCRTTSKIICLRYEPVSASCTSPWRRIGGKGRKKDEKEVPTACGELPLAFDFTMKQLRQLHHSLFALTVQGTLLKRKEQKSGKRTSTGQLTERWGNVGKLLISLNVRLPSLASTHEHPKATNCLPPDAGGKILRTQLIRARWGSTGLPRWLTNHPVV